MNLLIQQRSHGFLKGGNMATVPLQAHGLVTAADGSLPEQNQSHNHNQRSNAVQQDQLRLVTLRVNVSTLGFIPNLALLAPAKTGQHGDPVDTALRQYQENNNCNFNSQIKQTVNQLAIEHMGKTHDQAGKPDHRTTVFQCITQGIGIFSFPPGSSFFGQLV